MAKTYKKKAPSAKKLTKEELEGLVNIINKLNGSLSEVGGIELKKHKLLHAIDLVEVELNKYQNNLKEKYGDIQVNTQTGEIKKN